jgi:Asp/Glu/hydantoin racemase
VASGTSFWLAFGLCAGRRAPASQQWRQIEEDASMASRPRRRILVVNPNSNEVVTKGLADALAAVAFKDGPEIDCVTLTEGPYGIETQEHVESVTLPLRRLVAGSNEVDAFVIACYSDPGLQACREATARPVFGINEAGVLTALARGEWFGIIAIGQRSIRRHVRYMRQMGLMERFAGERPLDMSVAETAAGENTLARMIEVGGALRDKDGADVIVMGCAGMARHRRPLEAALGVPVIDPTQAAVAMAIGAVQFAAD